MEGTNTEDIDVELVDCEMMVVETGVMVELVADVVIAGGTVLVSIVVDVITVDVGSNIEVVDGDGASQIVYSQCNVYESEERRNACNNISN